MKPTLYRLRCQKCGHVIERHRRIRRCDEVIYGAFHEARICGGDLVAAPRPKRRVRRTTEQEVAYAERMLRASITKVKLATTLVDRWQGRLRRLNRKLQDELRASPGARPPRHITLPGHEVTA